MSHNVPMGGIPPVNPSGGRGWLDGWMQYAKARATMTDSLMIEAVGLYLMSVVVARRAVLEELDMPPVYPNLYVLLCAPTTYYHKSTVMRLAQTVIESVAPHLLLPSQMTPEVLMAKLAGQKAINYESLPPDVKQQEMDGAVFAGVRSIIGEEAHKLVNRDYLAPIKDIWLEVFDNPSSMSKEFVKNGRVVVHHPSLSLLLATTPANMQAIFDGGDTGLFSRFAIITPQTDRIKRVANVRMSAKQNESPHAVYEGLRAIYKMLPMPTTTSFDELTITISDEALDGYNAYADWLHEQCAPSGVLDDKLRGTYGRLGMMAFKVAMLLAMGHGRDHITADDWGYAQLICESWRESAHRARDLQVVNSAENQLQNDIVRYLKSSEYPRTMVEIAGACGGDRRMIERVINSMIDAQMAVLVKDDNQRKLYHLRYKAKALEVSRLAPSYRKQELAMELPENLRLINEELKRLDAIWLNNLAEGE